MSRFDNSIAFCDTTTMRSYEVRKIRERLGLSQGALGKRLGKHWSTVSRWENGHTPVPQTVALALKLLALAKGE